MHIEAGRLRGKMEVCMDIRYVCSDDDRRAGEVLAAVAERAKQAGLNLAGTVPAPTRGAAGEKCHIVLALLPDGEERDISISMPVEVPGCRLDPGALEQAVLVVQERLPTAQALIVNTFGKQEAAGRGLVAAIGDACERDIPVLVGVSRQWLDAFLAFVDGRALPLPADEDRVFSWLNMTCLREAAA